MQAEASQHPSQALDPGAQPGAQQQGQSRECGEEQTTLCRRVVGVVRDVGGGNRRQEEQEVGQLSPALGSPAPEEEEADDGNGCDEAIRHVPPLREKDGKAAEDAPEAGEGRGQEVGREPEAGQEGNIDDEGSPELPGEALRQRIAPEQNVPDVPAAGDNREGAEVGERSRDSAPIPAQAVPHQDAEPRDYEG